MADSVDDFYAKHCRATLDEASRVAYYLDPDRLTRLRADALVMALQCEKDAEALEHVLAGRVIRHMEDIGSSLRAVAKRLREYAAT